MTFRIVDYLSMIIYYILLYRNILNSSYFFLDWHILDFLLWDYLFIILFNILYCVVICCNNFSWYFFYYFSLFILKYFSLHRHSLYNLPLFILCNLFFIWNVIYTALTLFYKSNTFYFLSLSNCDSYNSTHLVGC